MCSTLIPQVVSNAVINGDEVKVHLSHTPDNMYDSTHDSTHRNSCSDPHSIFSPNPHDRDIEFTMKHHFVNTKTPPNSQFFSVGDQILGTKTTYSIMFVLSKNAALCRDSASTVFVIKGNMINDINFSKEIVLAELLNKGRYKLIIKKPKQATEKIVNTASYEPVSRTDHETFKTVFESYFNALKKKIMNIIKPNAPVLPNPLTQDIDKIEHEVIIAQEKFDPDRVPGVVETFEISGNIFQVLKYCGMDMLSYLLATESIPINSHLTVGSQKNMCKELFVQLVDIVRKLHGLGIAHGDISLENFCVDTTQIDKTTLVPYVRVIDFGFAGIHPSSQIAKIFNGTQQAKHFVLTTKDEHLGDDKKSLNCKVTLPGHGKQNYVSPERFKANHCGDSTYCMYKDDVYALGVLLFMILCRRLPYKSIKTYQQLYTLISGGYWQKIFLSCTISPLAIDLIKKMIAMESQRLSIDEVATHPWLMIN